MDDIASWRGVPLSDVPRDELEQALVDAHQELQEAQSVACDASIREIHTLAELGRERLKPPVLKLLGFA